MRGGTQTLTENHCAQTSLAEWGGYSPPPFSFWKCPLSFFTILILLDHTGSKSNSICRVVCAIHNFQVYDIHILPDHDRHPSAISPRMPSLELHFRHRKCSPLYFRAPPFPSCLFPHAGGKYFLTCFCIQEMLSENLLLMKTLPKAQRTWGIE